MSDPPRPDWTAAGRTWLGALGVLVVAASLVWTAGPVGLLVAGPVAVLWYVVPGPYTAATGVVGAAAVVARGVDPAPVAALGAGVLAILAAPMAREREWPRGLAVAGVLGLSLGTLAWVGRLRWHPRWLAGLAVVTVVAVGLYAVHRYGVVTLALEGVTPQP